MIINGGYVAVTNEDKLKVREEFKGDSFDEEAYFPRGLGAKHPFDFKSCEVLYKKSGLINGTINKTADEIVSDFEIKVKNPNAQALIDDFIHDTNFHQVLREWAREGLLKGNGFIELDLKELKVRILNANHMYVRRNTKGKVLEYNQWTKPFKQFNRAQLNETNNFKPNEIAHLIINKIPNEPYGYGIIYSNERVIENLVANEQDLQKIISRKAGSPYHVKVGQPGANTPPAVVQQAKENMQYLRNTVEWVTDGDTEIKTIDFANLGEKLTDAQLYFFRQYLAGTEMPEVMMGSGQLNEGIAKVQLEVRKRKIAAYQEQVGSIIEEKIIKPLLNTHGFDETPEFIWELPTEEDINNRITRIKELLGLPMIQPALKAALEIELAKLLGFEKDVLDYLIQPKDAEAKAEEDKQKEIERQREEEIPQPEVPGAKANAAYDLDDAYFGKPGRPGQRGGSLPRNSGVGIGGVVANGASKEFFDSKDKIAEANGFKGEIDTFEKDLNDYVEHPTLEARNKIKAFHTSDSKAAQFEKDVTQERLKHLTDGKENIKLYRGTNAGESSSSRKGEVISWTNNKEVAQMFAAEKGTKVISSNINIKNVIAATRAHKAFTTYGSGESEYLVLE